MEQHTSLFVDVKIALKEAAELGADLNKGEIIFIKDYASEGAHCKNIIASDGRGAQFSLQEILENPHGICQSCLLDGFYDYAHVEGFDAKLKQMYELSEKYETQPPQWCSLSLEALEEYTDDLDELDLLRTYPSLKAWAERITLALESELSQIADSERETLEYLLHEKRYDDGHQEASAPYALINDNYAQLLERHRRAQIKMMAEDPRRILVKKNRGIGIAEGVTGWLIAHYYKRKNIFVLPMVYYATLEEADCLIVDEEPDEQVLETTDVLLQDGGEYKRLAGAYEAARNL